MRSVLSIGLSALLGASPAVAGEARIGGKLLLTGGVSTVEGSAGAGLATWSTIAGDETEDGIGGKVHATYVRSAISACGHMARPSAFAIGWSCPMPGRISIPERPATRWGLAAGLRSVRTFSG